MLAWAYLGYAPWFQRLLGVAEFVPALMLFFRRTARLAAVLMFAVLVNITLVNFRSISGTIPRSSVAKCRASTFTFSSISGHICGKLWRRYLKLRLLCGLCFAGQRRLFRLSFLQFCVSTIIMTMNATLDSSAISPGRGRSMERGHGQSKGFASTEKTRSRKLDAPASTSMFGSTPTTPWARLCRARKGVPLIPNQLSDKRAYRDVLESCSYFAEDRQPERVESEGFFDADRSQNSFQLTNLNLAGSTGKINGTYSANGRNLQMWGTRNGEKIEIVLKRLNWGKMWW
jgi:hypothetical protein